jgi:uncharacterized protein YndB with AHSA1/START domain
VNGTLHTVDGRPTLRFERRLEHPVEKVWQALTEPQQLSKWFPQDIEGDFTAGGRLRFLFREGEWPAFDGEVVEVDPPRVLAYLWGEDVLRFELAPDGDGCLLVFTDTIVDLGKAARDGAGWDVCLGALTSALDGGPAPVNRWDEFYLGYSDVFGPDAATAPIPGRDS